MNQQILLDFVAHNIGQHQPGEPRGAERENGLISDPDQDNDRTCEDVEI